MIELLEELLKWTKVTSIPHVKELLLKILQTDDEKIAFHNSDGRTSQEVAKLVGVSYVTVTKWWKVWTRAGIAESVGVRGGERARRIFSLEDFGIEIPASKEIKTEATTGEKPTQKEASKEEKA